MTKKFLTFDSLNPAFFLNKANHWKNRSSPDHTQFSAYRRFNSSAWRRYKAFKVWHL